MPTTLKMKSRKGLRSKFAGPMMRAAQMVEFEKLRPETKKEFEKRVENWSAKTKPKFIVKVYGKNPKVMSMGVIVVGDEHQLSTWKQLDKEGRRGGKIIVGKITQTQTVKGKHGNYQTRNLMRFREKYSPKTSPVDTYGGSGRRHGAWKRKAIVKQGAVKPRKFSENIMETFFEKEFRAAARRGYRRAFNKMTKGPQI